MATNRIQLKRTFTAGRTPNTTNLANSQYIAAGELALNLADNKLYTSNGSVLIELTGTANNALYLGGIAAAQYAYANQVGSASTPVRQVFTGDGACTTFTVTGGYVSNSIDVYVGGVKVVNNTDANVQSGSTIVFTTAPLTGTVIDVIGVQSYTSSSVVTNTYFQSTLTTYVQNTDSRTLSGNLTLSGLTTKSYAGAADASMIFSGRNDKGGGGVGAYYNDFIRASAGNGANGMWFRTNYTGDLQLINSAYTAAVLYVTQSGVLNVGGGNAAASTNNDATTNYISLNNQNSVIYDDGNMHIHSRNNGGSMWINTNGGLIILGNQSPVSGGAIASGIVMGSNATAKAYLSVYGSKSYSIGAYGFTASGGTGTGSSTTAPFSIYSDNRMNASEFDATSDERAKDIQGTIPLQTAVDFVKNIDGIHYTWNRDAVDHDDTGLKAGFGAQSIHKAGFDHMIAAIPNDKMKAQTDEDGWVHPKGFQLTVGYNQAIAYHHEVIKHLLNKIDELEKKLNDAKL